MELDIDWKKQIITERAINFSGNNNEARLDFLLPTDRETELIILKL